MKINKKDLIEGLSYALDISEKSYLSHSKHVAYISINIAKELNLSKQEKKDIYYTALLHDIGVTNKYEIGKHCEDGKKIILNLPIKFEISEYVYYHHEYFDGSGPFRIKGNKIPLVSQIICIANLFDLKFRQLKNLNLHNINSIKDWLENNKRLFSKKVYNAFNNLIEKEYIFYDYYNCRFNDVLINETKTYDEGIIFKDIKKFAEAFSKIIDNRSRFTYNHSIGVAKLVNIVVENLGYNKEIQEKMCIAALLHDIGKLAISKNIIDKKEKLTEEEKYEMRKHPYYTRIILQKINGFEEIANYASNHHEKLNGKGYPFHLRGSEIGELDRIMAICDIYQALTEARPYREKMSIHKAWNIIDEMAYKNELDRNFICKIKSILL